MALEDLTGPNVFIDALVEANPFGTDPKSEGDDHIRGVKNVLGNQFPALTEAVTATAAELNSTSTPEFPSGTIMLFSQSSAPTGWTKLTDRHDYAIITTTSTDGGTTLGSWVISGLTNASHTHSVTIPTSSGPAGGTVNVSQQQLNVLVPSTAHTHTISNGSADSQTPLISSDATWRPLHVKVIRGQKN